MKEFFFLLKVLSIVICVNICKFLLGHSFFIVGLTTVLQIRGASMGSQWAPIFCRSVALMREVTFLSCFYQFRASQSFHYRYF